MKRKPSGFTLNDISILLVAVSLMIGSFLKCQELSSNAKFTKDKKITQR
jgi:hypothetical protein